MKNIIQIAGVIDRAEAEMLIKSGVDWLGFPLRLPVHREDISEEDAADIIRSLQPPAAGVLIIYLDKATEVLELCRKLGVRIVQLHGEIAFAEIKKLKQANPQLFIIKSLIVKEDNLFPLKHQIDQFSAVVDAFITDTHDPVTGADGATGKTHDWNISRKLAAYSPKPVILAGGLNPENVRSAILQVQPAGVDAHTGVEDATGRKDAQKVANFVAGARAAFAQLESYGKT